jgi:hypothetical protein
MLCYIEQRQQQINAIFIFRGRPEKSPQEFESKNLDQAGKKGTDSSSRMSSRAYLAATP